MKSDNFLFCRIRIESLWMHVFSTIQKEVTNPTRIHRHKKKNYKRNDFLESLFKVKATYHFPPRLIYNYKKKFTRKQSYHLIQNHNRNYY